jgi:pilus assembly protein CpaF
MFGKRTVSGARDNSPAAMPPPAAAPKPAGTSAGQSTPAVRPAAAEQQRSDSYYATKSMIFGALVEAIDLAQLSRFDAESARERYCPRNHRDQERRHVHCRAAGLDQRYLQ